MPLPESFVDRLQKIVPEDRLDAVLATFEQPIATGFRVNTMLRDEDDVLSVLEDEDVPFTAVVDVQGAYTVPAEGRGALLASRPYADGHVYVQNVSSQLAPLALAPRVGERVLDLCAAPGSKTGQLSALVGPSGEVTAVEKVRPRFYKLKANVYAQGATNVLPWMGNGAVYWRREPESFDRVLVDAPCSTEGRFRAHDPETTAYWSLRKIREMRQKQVKLLWAGIQALKPGGTLVYSTCTFAPEENEAVVAKVLRTFGDTIEIVEAGLPTRGPVAEQIVPGLTEWNDRPFAPALAKTRRVLPSDTLEGFYIARIAKRSSTVDID
ncbi:RsmB/NOP family class I SAM-dependent RNA methyltransferase [Rubrivirga sp. IMCC43871]|uniref:RsmB/NOP family class I SAM-dependent RNA methyltransferase n=1 Tax=Rubrivirga sp. IMCC43871 TaxID=3391575 RepID=UPI00398FBF44